MQSITETKLLIIGSGPAGYSASIYAARANLDPIMIQGSIPGGQLTITTDVENYPGFAQSIQGPWLMQQMMLQSANVGANIIKDHINKVEIKNDGKFAYADSGKIFKAKAIIIATGANAKWLGLESETKFRGFGVSSCATCDGFFYKNKKVMVIGGGNTAVEEAIYLTKHAAEVILVHRRNNLRAEKILQQRLFDNPKIKIIWDSELTEVLGQNNPLSVTHAIIKNIENDKISKIKVDGIFIAIGHKPNTGMFKDILKMDEHGYIETLADSTKTSIDGIFAAGDVQDKIYRQAITAAGTGCMAALEAEKFLVH